MSTKDASKLNVSIDDGAVHFSHETTINFNPTQFIFDFKCVTPRVDPRSQQAPVLHIKHNTVMVDVYHAKLLYEHLGKSLANYEKQFGKIDKPKAVEKSESQKKEPVKETVPNYFG